MHVAKRKSARKGNKPTAGLNGKARSLRELKAFGIWAARADVNDPVQYTKKLRTRMEQGNDAH